MALRHREFLLSKGVTGALTGSDIVNDGYRGVLVFVDITTNGGSVTVTVEGKSPTGEYYDILVGSAEAGTGLGTVLIVYPGVAASANKSADEPLPPTWRVTTAVGAGSYDYDVAYAYIP